MKPSWKHRQRREVTSTFGEQVETKKPPKETEKKQLERWKKNQHSMVLWNPKEESCLGNN